MDLIKQFVTYMYFQLLENKRCFIHVQIEISIVYNIVEYSICFTVTILYAI